MRITQNTIFMTHLVSDIAAGKTVPAGMQRPYVWREEDVLALCDSIASRFPLGGILTWQPPQTLVPGTLAKPRLGPIAPDKGSHATRLILDGQNRLATLAWIMAGHEPAADLQDASAAEKDTWMTGRELFYDGEDRTFFFKTPEETYPRLAVPVRAAFTRGMKILRRYFNAWEAEGVSNERIDIFLKNWDVVERGFLESALVETCLESATPDEARHAFLRICRTGVPMDQADFDAAVAWLPSAN